MGAIVAVCTSPEKGTKKENVGAAQLVADWGLLGDAHGGRGHRQVSLLPLEEIQAFRAAGAEVSFGDFGENLVVSDLGTPAVGSRLVCGDVVLVVTQIGKECHQHCSIFQAMGRCIMPTSGIFATVHTGGTLQIGDNMTEEVP